MKRIWYTEEGGKQIRHEEKIPSKRGSKLNPKLALKSEITSQIILQSIFEPVYTYKLVKGGLNVASATNYLKMLKESNIIILDKTQVSKGDRIKKSYSFNFNSDYYKAMVSIRDDFDEEFLEILYTSKYWKNKLRNYCRLNWPNKKISKPPKTGNKMIDEILKNEPLNNSEESLHAKLNHFYSRNTFVAKVCLIELEKKEKGEDMKESILEGKPELRNKLGRIIDKMSEKDSFEMRKEPDNPFPELFFDSSRKGKNPKPKVMPIVEWGAKGYPSSLH